MSTIHRPLQNFISNAVKDKIKATLKISTFHFEALTNQQADPEIAALLASYGRPNTRTFYRWFQNAARTLARAKEPRKLSMRCLTRW
jgi:hypothetical protein